MDRIFSLIINALVAIVIIALVPACSMRMPGNTSTTSATVPAERDYLPIDYKKWASGMYADEFVGKAVLVEGYFQNSRMSQYRVNSDITFTVREKSLLQIRQDGLKAASSGKPSTDLFKMHMVLISAPLSMRDQIYVVA